MVLRGKPVGEQGAADRWTAFPPRLFREGPGGSRHAERLVRDAMYSIFLIGNIASGKSTAAKYLEAHGARRIDLDQVAKSLYTPGSTIVSEIADTFGWDVLDSQGSVRYGLLAQRAFESPESVSKLNSIVHPALKEYVGQVLLPSNCCSTLAPSFELTVIEVSAPMGFEDVFTLADEVLAVTAPLAVRRQRACERGMSQEDFDARASLQPDEEELRSLADAVIDNTLADDSLYAQLDAWAASRGIHLEGNGYGV